MKKILTLAALLASFNLWAADVFVALSDMTVDGTTVKYDGNEVKAKNNMVHIELPADNIHGTIVIYGSSTKEDRFLYICGSQGTAKDESRGIVMNKDGQSVDFTADDIKTVETKPYLVFSTTDDFKFKKFEYTYEGGTPSVTPALNVSPAAVTLAVTAEQPNPTAKVTFSGKNLETGTYALTVPNLIGLSVTPTEVTIGEDGILNAELTIAYTSETDVEAAETALSLTIGELTKSVTIHYSASLTPVDPGEKEYVTSLNIEQLVLDQSKGADIKSILTEHHWVYNNIDALDSLNDDKANRNYPYLGLKLKKTDASLAGWLQQGATLRARFGNVGADFLIVINGTEQTQTNALANATVEDHNEWTYTAEADAYIEIRCNSTKTLTVKQLMINEPIAAVTLPDPTTPVDPTLSSDATLKKLSYDDTAIGLKANTLEYTVQLPKGTTQIPTVTAEANDPKATLNIIQAKALPGSANIVVTAEDQETVLTYTLTFTIESELPIDDANVYAYLLETFTITDNTYEASMGEVKAKNYDYVFVEVPSETAEGSITMACTSSNSQRFIYLYSDHGTTKDESRRLAMENKYTDPIEFNASDILTASERHYLVFATTDDYKIKSVKYTLNVPAGPSTDATLKSLSYNETAIELKANQLDYAIELPAGTSEVPVVSAETNDEAATLVITQAEALPGTAKVNVTAEDGTTTKEYTISFTVESGLPVVQSATWENIVGQAVIDQTAKTVTGRVSNSSSLVLAPTFSGKHIASWTPEEAQDFSAGAVFYTFVSETNESIVYAVSITEAPALATDATLKSLSVDGYSIDFDPGIYAYEVELQHGTTAVPTVRYELNDANATAVKTDAAALPGTTKIVVTAEDGVTTLTYAIAFTVALPPSDLTVHEPEVYEAETMYGGYGGTLSVVSGREYEVYYAGKDGESCMTVGIAPTQKLAGIAVNKTSTSCEAPDGWFKAATTSISNYDNPNIQEFQSGKGAVHKMQGTSYRLHIKGYDQFSLYAADKNVEIKDGSFKKEQRFQIFIDNVMQPETQCSKEATIRRYDITTGEHIIEVKALDGGASMFYGFSLRISQEPRVKWLYGNDSTQRVKATEDLDPIRYFAKYNALGETKLVWEQETPEGIELAVENSNEMGDTLVLRGTANCRAGVYPYSIVCLYNNLETSRARGKFKVINQLRPMTETDGDAFENEAMDILQFRYYAYLEEDLHFSWLSQTEPEGITTTAKNGIFTIGGTPTQMGTYTYRLFVTDGDTIQGKIIVRRLDLGNNPILYLYKHNGAYDKDGVFRYLSEHDYNLIPRKAKDGLRPADQYANYKWILISEDADANNEEVLAILRGGADLPVLNMQAFTYVYEQNEDLPDGWGEPDNGSITSEGRFITVQRDDHPIFKAINAKRGDKIQLLDSIGKKGLMPINIYLKGTLCLATSLTRSKENYYGDGEPQTFLHEIQASMRGGKKYICLPLSLSGGAFLSKQGGAFIESVISYLISNEPSLTVPSLQITSFALGDVPATISEAQSTIHLEIDRTVYPEDQLNLTHIVPTITKTSPYTFTTPAEGQAMDLSWAHFTPVQIEISDYINRRVYSIDIHLFASDGIEQVYTVGEWVNIYDLFGRKITTTNQNIYTLPIPNGVYIIVTESGKTLKITR